MGRISSGPAHGALHGPQPRYLPSLAGQLATWPKASARSACACFGQGARAACARRAQRRSSVVAATMLGGAMARGSDDGICQCEDERRTGTW
jgi:hypothetical protein